MSLKTGCVYKPDLILSVILEPEEKRSCFVMHFLFFTLRGIFYSSSMYFVLERKVRFSSFQLNETIVKLKYISSFFQISNILIFVERECHLPTSQLLCMTSAAYSFIYQCESARPQPVNFIIENINGRGAPAVPGIL